MSASGGVGGMDEPKTVLRVIIEHMLYPVTIDVLKQVRSRGRSSLQMLARLKCIWTQWVPNPQIPPFYANRIFLLVYSHWKRNRHRKGTNSFLRVCTFLLLIPIWISNPFFFSNSIDFSVSMWAVNEPVAFAEKWKCHKRKYFAISIVSCKEMIVIIVALLKRK